MAVNVQVTPGAGITIAADEVNDGTLGSCKVQYVKIMDGTLDGTSKAAVGPSGLAVHARQNGTWNVAVSGIAVSPPTAGGGLPAFGTSMSNGSQWIPLTNSYTALNIGPMGISSLSTAPFIYNGSTFEPERTQKVFKDLSGSNVGVLATAWTPSTGKKINFMGGHISVASGVSILFEDNVGGQFIYRTPVLEPNKPYVFELGNGIPLAASDRVLKITQIPNSPQTTITGTLFGTEE
jgi:hypothetical protein